MTFRPRFKVVLPILASLLLFASAFPISLRAGEPSGQAAATAPRHIASPGEVRAAAAAVPALRDARIDTIARVLESGPAREMLGRWGIRPAQALEAVSRLDDNEIAALAARADGFVSDVQGGHMNTTFVLILLAAFLLPMVIALALS